MAANPSFHLFLKQLPYRGYPITFSNNETEEVFLRILLNFDEDDLIDSKLRGDEFKEWMSDRHFKWAEEWTNPSTTAVRRVALKQKLFRDAFSGEDKFHSFCRESWQERDRTEHCRVFGKCNYWREWHCGTCNKCTYGISIP
jgi:hypothetical protein